MILRWQTIYQWSHLTLVLQTVEESWRCYTHPQPALHTVPVISTVLSPVVCGVLCLFDLPAAFNLVDPILLLETLHLLDSRTPLSLVFLLPHRLFPLVCPCCLLISLTSKIEVPWAQAVALSSSLFILMLGLLAILFGLQGFKPFLGWRLPNLYLQPRLLRWAPGL